MTTPSASDQRGPPKELPRRLSLWSTIAVTMGIMIGSGIFRAPATVADAVGSVGGVGIVWLVGGLATLCLALCVAELGTLFPRAGGAYVYLREAFGPGAAFTYGWTYLLVVAPASWAAVALVFAEYSGLFVSLTPGGERVVATAVIAFVTAANIVSMRFAAGIQNVATSAKILALAAIAAVIFGVGGGEGGALAHGPLGVSTTLGALVVGLVAALWAYDGVVGAASVFGEVRDPARTLPRALIAGVLGVTVLYLFLNAAFLYALPIEAVAASAQVASDAMHVAIGSVGASVIAACVMLSAFGCNAALAMTDPRVFFAMARDGLFFRGVGAVHPRFETPHVAVAACGGLTILYIWVRSIEELAAQFVLGLWPFYAFMVLGMMRLRAIRPNAERPYRTPGYPFVPVAFMAAAATLVLVSFIELPAVSFVNLAIIAAAFPIYAVWRRLGPRLPSSALRSEGHRQPLESRSSSGR